MNNTTNKKINGPLNIIRLVGTIDNVDKVIYILLDYEKNDTQTMCYDTINTDVVQYLVQNFKNGKNNKFYDFFRVINPSADDLKSFPRYEKTYISSVNELYMRMMQKNEKFSDDDYDFKNVRLHQVQSLYFLIPDIASELFVYAFYCYCNNSTYNVKHIIENLQKMKKICSEILGIISDDNSMSVDTDASTTSDEKPIVDIEKIVKLWKKMSGKYKHSNINKLMNDILHDIKQKIIYLSQKITDTIVNIQKISDSIPEYGDVLVKGSDGDYSYGLDARDHLLSNANIFMHCNDLVVDWYSMLYHFDCVFILRRMLDKDYITNVVAYIGINLALPVIQFLIQKCNFRITNAASSGQLDMTQLNIILKKEKFSAYTDLLCPHVLNQCSDVSSFSDNFD